MREETTFMIGYLKGMLKGKVKKEDKQMGEKRWKA